MTQGPLSIQHALDDFHKARQRAVVQEILGRLTGTDTRLLSFEKVRQILKTQGSIERGLQEIPLDAIIGSVNRYEDFTRSFLPRNAISPHRWARIEIEATGLAGLPPIEVYRVGESYFVIDGNHRVSVARHFGAESIQAYVHEVPSRVNLTPMDNLEDLLLKIGHVQFLENTQIENLIPEADLRLTAPGQYHLLEEHITVHRYYMGLDYQRDIDPEEAVTHWYETVYLPVIKIIREQGLQREFPDRTEADLYLWLAEHRAELEAELEIPVEPYQAASDLKEQQSYTSNRRISRMGYRIHDALIPDALESGPPAGVWRRDKLSMGEETCLFTDILVTIDGTEAGWRSLDQAIIIAKQETSFLNGLHITQTNKEEDSLPQKIRSEFARRIQEVELDGRMAVTAGPVARTIVERSRWNDLVVINLNYPPAKSSLAKMGSGLRELILRCPRPILMVPNTVSELVKPLLAYDGSPKAEEALYVATYICGKWKLPLAIVSVEENRRDLEVMKERALSYTQRYGVEAKLFQKSGSISKAILEAREEADCDWIIMGGYGDPPLVNLLLDNVLDKVLRESNSSHAVVPLIWR